MCKPSPPPDRIFTEGAGPPEQLLEYPIKNKIRYIVIFISLALNLILGIILLIGTI